MDVAEVLINPLSWHSLWAPEEPQLMLEFSTCPSWSSPHPGPPRSQARRPDCRDTMQRLSCSLSSAWSLFPQLPSPQGGPGLTGEGSSQGSPWHRTFSLKVSTTSPSFLGPVVAQPSAQQSPCGSHTLCPHLHRWSLYLKQPSLDWPHLNILPLFC